MQMNDKTHGVGVSQTDERQNCITQINISNSQSLMVQRLLIIRGLGTSKDTLDATLMGSHKIHGPKAKDGGAAPGQVLDVKLSQQLLLTQEEF